ncbi:MAG TPA: formyltransferase family protein [Candidatus Dormibacteraeota bacterium]|jgi:methionyl-tRNA formyltransferase|nr:formyltransferase family protein [Candidatus Dormibacteraeota bacterium]
MPVTSPYLDAAREELWARDSFSFIPDRQLPPPDGALPQRTGGGPRILFAGFPSDYSLAFLYGLLQLDVQVAAIITSPGAHPAILGHNALSRIAEHLGIPLLREWRVNDEHARKDIADLEPDAVLMASFDQIIGARALAIPRHGWLNVHPSPLPLYRGPEPIYWMLADGAAQAGITLHRAVPRFDAGPILAQRLLPIAAGDNAGTLTRKLCAAGVDALPEALDKLLRDAPGLDLDMSSATYRPSVGHRDLGVATSAAEAERMVRAGLPNMPAYAIVDGRCAYVLGARVVPDSPTVNGTGLRYGDGVLELTETGAACGCHHDQPDCPHREAV